MGEAELKLLASIIIRKLKEEFALKHLSGNLVNTISVEMMSDEIKINIPAQTYNMLKYLETGVIVHDSFGSYASKIDEDGSSLIVPTKGGSGYKTISPRNHRGYIDRIIDSSIEEWKNIIQDEVISVEG